MKLDFVPDTRPSTFIILSSFSPHVNPNRFYYWLHFADEETEVQRLQEIYTRSQLEHDRARSLWHQGSDPQPRYPTARGVPCPQSSSGRALCYERTVAVLREPLSPPSSAALISHRSLSVPPSCGNPFVMLNKYYLEMEVGKNKNQSK